MKKIHKNTILFLLMSALVCLNAQSVFADNKVKVYVNEGFGEFAANSHTVSGYDVVGDAKIAHDGVRNKSLLLKGNSIIDFAGALKESYNGDFVYSFDIKISDGSSSVNAGVKSDTTKFPLIKIEDRKALMADLKKAGTILPNAYTNIAVSYCKADKRIDVYINNGCTVEKWKLKSAPGSINGFFVSKLSGDADVYIDNIKFYTGSKIQKILDSNAYSDKEEEDLFINQDVGDFTYFHSMCISNIAQGYVFFTKDEKGNEIECQRYDYTNPDKGDQIIIKKLNDNDVYFDIATTVRQQGFDPTKRYKYFMFKTDLLITTSACQGQLFMIRDSTSAASNADYNVGYLSGTSITANNVAVARKLNLNTWYTYTVYLNLNSMTADYYLDGVLAAKEVPINSAVKNIDKVRVGINKGGPGELHLKNCEFTGLEKPPVSGNVTKTSVFYDDSLVKEYLDQKLGAFHSYSDKVYYDGKKHDSAADIIYENNEMYASVEDINNVLKTDLRIAGDSVQSGNDVVCKTNENGLVPVKEVISAVGKYYIDDNSGLIIAGNSKFNFDMSQQKEQWYDTYYKEIMKTNSYYAAFTELTQFQQLNFFMMYDRPLKEQLEEQFLQAVNKEDSHPRLLINDEKIKEIKELAKTDLYYKSLIDGAIKLADSAMGDKVAVYAFNDNMRTNSNAEKFETRVKKLAFAYLLTGDKKYADRAWLEMDSVSRFPDINFSHVIDTGMWSSGLSFAYDWLYDYMTPEQRKQICDAIVRLELEPIGRAYYSGMPSNGSSGTARGGGIQATNMFARWKSNYGAFVNSGVMISALAVCGEAPDIAFDCLEKSIRSWEYVLMGFAPDGVWLESPNYWKTMLSDMAYSFGALEGVYGNTFKLMEAPGIEKTCRDLLGYTSLNQRFGYGDDQPSDKVFLSFDSFSFFSKYYNQKDVAMVRKIKLDPDLRKKYGNRMETADMSILDIIYYMPDVTEDDLNTIKRVDVMRGMESFVVHEDFKDPNAFFLSAAGGPTTFYHAANDAGDFTFDMNGEAWGYIIGAGNYNVGDAETRYSTRAEGHNTLTINPDEKYSQRAGSFCKLIDYDESDYGAYAVYDMTDLYEAGKDMKRGFMVSNDFTKLTVRDEMTFKENSNGYWFMHTDADAFKLDENTIILSKHGKSITCKINVDKAAKYNISIMEAYRLPTSPQLEGDATYPKIRKIAIYFEGKEADLDVQFGETVSNESGLPISQWTAPTEGNKENQANFAYKIFADGIECNNKSIIPLINPNRYPDIELNRRIQTALAGLRA